ncbi:hypothetical protein BDQ17DRAFT_1428786 [Cyathus striatus]|nr:hypothetical protein BDQ17DRAFT_1428786 [Cyathus striatus]
MTTHKRNSLDHRMLKVRQAPGSTTTTGNETKAEEGAGNAESTPSIESPPIPSTTSSTPASSPSPSSTTEKASSTAAIPSSTTTSSTPVQSSTSSQAAAQETSTTSSTTSSTTTSSSATSSSTTSSTSSTSASTSSTSSSSSTIATSSVTSKATVTSAPTTTSAGRLVQTSSFASVSRTSIDSDSTISASAIPSGTSTGALGTGAIVGTIVGAIAGLAVVGFIVMFLLRRYRKRSRRSIFYPTDFRTSNAFPDTSASLDAPHMGQRGHTVAPSIGSGAGIAGMGAGAYGAVGTSTAASDANTAAAAAAQQLNCKSVPSILMAKTPITTGMDLVMVLVRKPPRTNRTVRLATEHILPSLRCRWRITRRHMGRMQRIRTLVLGIKTRRGNIRASKGTKIMIKMHTMINNSMGTTGGV